MLRYPLEVPTDVWPRLASQKLAQIRYICDFSLDAPPEEVRNRELKTQSLTHMIEYFSLKLTDNFPDVIYPLVIEAVGNLIIRNVIIKLF